MTWQLDSAHSSIGFSVRHMMISKVRGEFQDFSAKIELDPSNLNASQITAVVDVNSINTRQQDRDNHLRSADFFDVENHPKMVFESTAFRSTGADQVELTGKLTIRGTTHDVTLQGEQRGPVKNPLNQSTAVGYTLTGSINREDFGLTWNQAMETGGVLVGKNIDIHIDVEVFKSA